MATINEYIEWMRARICCCVKCYRRLPECIGECHHCVADKLQLIFECGRIFGQSLFRCAQSFVFFIVWRQRTIRIAALEMVFPKFCLCWQITRINWTPQNEWNEWTLSHTLTDKPWIPHVIFNSQTEEMLLESNNWISLRLHGQRSFHLIEIDWKILCMKMIFRFYTLRCYVTMLLHFTLTNRICVPQRNRIIYIHRMPYNPVACIMYSRLETPHDSMEQRETCAH